MVYEFPHIFAFVLSQSESPAFRSLHLKNGIDFFHPARNPFLYAAPFAHLCPSK